MGFCIKKEIPSFYNTLTFELNRKVKEKWKYFYTQKLFKPRSFLIVLNEFEEISLCRMFSSSKTKYKYLSVSAWIFVKKSIVKIKFMKRKSEPIWQTNVVFLMEFFLSLKLTTNSKNQITHRNTTGRQYQVLLWR